MRGGHGSLGLQFQIALGGLAGLGTDDDGVLGETCRTLHVVYFLPKEWCDFRKYGSLQVQPAELESVMGRGELEGDPSTVLRWHSPDRLVRGTVLADFPMFTIEAKIAPSNRTVDHT